MGRGNPARTGKTEGDKPAVNPQFVTPQRLGVQLCKYLMRNHPDEKRVQEFIDQGADLTTRSGKSFRTPLIMASRNGLTKIAKLLLSHMEEVDHKDSLGQTALLWADSIELATALLEKGADIHTRDNAGSTVIIDAVASGNGPLLRFLLGVSADDIDHQNNLGETALITAAHIQEEECLHILLDHHANPLLADNEGKTAENHLAENADQDKPPVASQKRLHAVAIDFNTVAIHRVLMQPIALPMNKPRLVKSAKRDF